MTIYMYNIIIIIMTYICIILLMVESNKVFEYDYSDLDLNYIGGMRNYGSYGANCGMGSHY